jgi:acyl carrier protein phosphodiesterase
MNKRTKGKSKMNLAIEDLKNLELDLESDFIIFFKDLIEFTNQKIREIKNKV